MTVVKMVMKGKTTADELVGKVLEGTATEGMVIKEKIARMGRK